MKLSYAQRLEDYHLETAFDGQQSGFYVDIGAGHPVADNVSYWFYLRGWRGLVVEPQQRLIDLYRHLRPRDTAVCSLVGNSVGEASFHVVNMLHGLSTMLEQGAKKATELGVQYETVRRPIVTLAHLFETHSVGRIDFMKVDVEGAEGEVFAGADWQRWRPRVIVAETISPGVKEEITAAWQAVLVQQGYHLALFDGLNEFYVAEEETALFARFPRAPAAWDVVRHLYEFGRAPENSKHPDHALARKLVAAFLARLPTMSDEQLTSLLDDGGLLDSTFRIWLDQMNSECVLDDRNWSDVPLKDAIKSDFFRAALGRISAPFDGGLMLDPGNEPAE
jgi:FkbM family methyltransferase